MRKRIRVVFFRSETGAEPVRDFLKSMEKRNRQRIGADIKTAEYRWPVMMPVCRPLGSGLFEIRTNLSNGIVRILFSIQDGEMVLLHGFIKKSRQTRDQDIRLARQRKKLWLLYAGN